jgi:hypothetical protein
MFGLPNQVIVKGGGVVVEKVSRIFTTLKMEIKGCLSYCYKVLKVKHELSGSSLPLPFALIGRF